MNMLHEQPKGIVLFRGITPGEIGFDVHGGYGETWTHDFEHAACYARGKGAYVLKAILPDSAKRLVLTTEPDEQGFNYEVMAGILELEQVIGRSVCDPYARRGSGFIPYEDWDPYWTIKLIEAGYDSLFTAGFEGPEEYVLNSIKLIMLPVVSSPYGDGDVCHVKYHPRHPMVTE